MKIQSRYFYLLSFLEGGAVMACELIGAKMLAPYFGTSLYVWAAALGITLGGLMSGYFLGGLLSKKYPDNPPLLYWILIAAGISLFAMPFTSSLIMEATIGMSLQMGAVVSLLVFMFPPLVFMGMVSPLIINLLTRHAKEAGNSAGSVYAVSTLGGILLTFLMGFYVIPTFGLNNPAILTGLLLAFLPTISLLRSKRLPAAILFVGMVLLGGWKMTAQPKTHENFNVIYQSEGILGQVKVVDHPSYDFTEDARMGRGLIVNNTLQTFVGLDNDLQYSIWDWSTYFPTAASIFPKGSKVLLLGLGGGTIVKQLHRLGFEVDVVEIDKRIWDVSVEHFNMDPSTNVIIDDARHALKVANKQYDIIIYDTFLSESVPEHLLTIKGFEDAKNILKPNGMLMINFYGFIEGPVGKAARSVYKTLEASSLKVDILATPGMESSRNLIFLASKDDLDFQHADYEEPQAEKIVNLEYYFLDPSTIDLSDAVILSDNVPLLSKLYAPAAIQWRKSYNAYYRRHFGSY